MREKVLIVHNYYQIPGGEDTVVANELEMLRAHGHEVILYTRDNKELNGMNAVRKLLLAFTTVFNYRTYKDIKNIIRNKKIDVVHVHNTLNLVSLAVYYAARSCKVPVVQTIHNFRLMCPGATYYRDGRICEDCMQEGLGCALKHKCYRKSRLQTLACVIATSIHRKLGIYGKINYLCLTDFNRRKILELNKAGVKIDENQVYVKPNFMPKTEREIVTWPERGNYIVFAGRLDKTKGIDLLIKAWKKFEEGLESEERLASGSGKAREGDFPKLIVCGDGPMRKWCDDFIAENHISGIEMRGFTGHDETVDIIRRAKALVLPTRWYEGFPMSIAEAFSVGTTVIVPDMGNVGAIVEDEVTGLKYKYDEDNEEHMIVSIAEICERVFEGDSKNIQCMHKLNENAYSVFNEKYTQDINYNTLKEIYESCISVYNS